MPSCVLIGDQVITFRSGGQYCLTHKNIVTLPLAGAALLR